LYLLPHDHLIVFNPIAGFNVKQSVEALAEFTAARLTGDQMKNLKAIIYVNILRLISLFKMILN